jgi:hypothetical protein
MEHIIVDKNVVSNVICINNYANPRQTRLLCKLRIQMKQHIFSAVWLPDTHSLELTNRFDTPNGKASDDNSTTLLAQYRYITGMNEVCV